jgi:type I restriction enzyme S subunit
VGAGNIESGTGRLQAIQSARDEELISGKFLFDNSVVLYSKIRPYLMKVARPDFSGLCSADIYPLAVKPGRADRDFLFYLLLTDSFTEYAIRGSARAGMPKVNRDHLFAYRTSTPPLAEQRRIVAILDEAFEGIATAKAHAERNLRNVRELSEALGGALFKEVIDGASMPRSLSELCELIVDCEHKTAPTQEHGFPSIRTPNIGVGSRMINDLFLEQVRV